MHKLTSILAAGFLLGTANISMANDQGSNGSMDLERPVSELNDQVGNVSQKQDARTGDARGSTTGKKLIKSDAQRHDAQEGGLDGVK